MNLLRADGEISSRRRTREPMSSSRLLSLCDWLPPDFGAVGQYALIAARAAAEAGRDVTLVGLSSSGDSTEEMALGSGRLRIVRVRAATYDRANLGRRLAWTLATKLRLLRRAWRAARAADEILFTGSPPFRSCPASGC